MSKPCLVLFVLLAAAKQGVVSYYDDSSEFVYRVCDQDYIGNYSANSTYEVQLLTVLSTLESQASLSYSFYNTSNGVAGSEIVYGQYYCSGYVAIPACSNCLHEAGRRVLRECPLAKSVIIWHRGCTLRYSNQSMFSIDQSNNSMAWSYRGANLTYQHVEVIRATMESAIDEATDENKYTGIAKGYGRLSDQESVYCQVKCSPDLNATQCHSCLSSLWYYTDKNNINGSLVQTFFPNCQMMYNVSNLYLVSPEASWPPTQGKGNKHLIVVYIALPVALLSLLFALAIWVYRRNKRHFDADRLDEIRSAEFLKYDISTIRSATNNFSPSLKLGQGGYGYVYKGKLENGQEIAVKRLFQKSQEGIEEFKKEVLFVAKLQHRNLVKLLGYCLTGQEKLLIFEFLPNLSMDNFLNDATKRASLEWETRYKIILGVARGLFYLHEDSGLKIIHRDLKPQNILLDEAMNPKIADFGLAKSFNLDQSIANTHTIVGTYGYLSPEYAMAGQLSTKSDVYSFGVIVLEIVTSKRNIIQENQPSLFHQTWKLWSEGNALDIIDPTLCNTYSAEEALACIHIGLLCIQEEPGSRPTMAKVISALNGHIVSLPQPSPPFIFTLTEDVSEIRYNSVLKISNEYLLQ